MLQAHESQQVLRVCVCVAIVQLSNVLSNEALFYTCIIPFIAFFGSFAFIMYPLRDQLHPTGALHCMAPALLRMSLKPQAQHVL